MLDRLKALPFNLAVSNNHYLNLLLRIAIPILGVGLCKRGIQMIDLFWIGKISDVAINVYAVAMTVAMILFFLSFIMSYGVTVPASQAIEADQSQFRQIIWAGYALNAVLSVFTICVVFLFIDDILVLFNLQPSEHAAAILYSQILSVDIALGYFINFMISTLNISHQARGVIKLWFIAFILNVGLDYVFMFGVGSFQGFGLVGCAIATTISSMFVLIGLLVCHDVMIKGFFTHRLKLAACQSIVKNGFYPMLSQMSRPLLDALILILIMDYGEKVLAAYNLGTRAFQIALLFFLACDIAMTTELSKALASRDQHRIEQVKTAGLILCLLLSFPILLFFLFFGDSLMGLLSQNDYIIYMSSSFIFMRTVFGSFYIFLAYLQSAFKSYKKSYIPTIVTYLVLCLNVVLIVFATQFYPLEERKLWLMISLSALLELIFLMLFIPLLSDKRSALKESVT
jgi:Na+-driven multidrug efflux pump